MNLISLNLLLIFCYSEVVCLLNDIRNDTDVDATNATRAPIGVTSSAAAVKVARFTTGRVPDEQRLYENLLVDYEPSVRPVLHSSGTVNVNFKLTLNQIVDLDERKQLLTTNVFIDQEWTDEQLAWNESTYNGVKTLRVLSSQVWLPDTFMLNNADDESTGYLQGIYVLLKSSGTVVWPIPIRLRTSCKVDITYFPFDDQLCTLLFGSSVYSHWRVAFNGSLNRNEQNYVDNSEWDLLSITFDQRLRRRLSRSDVTVDLCTGFVSNATVDDDRNMATADDCRIRGQRGSPSKPTAVSASVVEMVPGSEPDSDIYTELRYQVHIRRRSFYFAFNVIVPCLMLSVLTLLTFWLPATSNEKVSLGLSVFLTYSMFMLLIAEEVPTTSESVPLIGIYMITVMMMISVSVMMAVIVINCYFRGFLAGHPPRWVRRVVLDWFSKPLRMKHDVETTAANLHLSEDIEKRYACPVHQKTSLKSRPPTPRPSRRNPFPVDEMGPTKKPHSNGNKHLSMAAARLLQFPADEGYSGCGSSGDDDSHGSFGDERRRLGFRQQRGGPPLFRSHVSSTADDYRRMAPHRRFTFDDDEEEEDDDSDVDQRPVWVKKTIGGFKPSLFVNAAYHPYGMHASPAGQRPNDGGGIKFNGGRRCGGPGSRLLSQLRAPDGVESDDEDENTDEPTGNRRMSTTNFMPSPAARPSVFFDEIGCTSAAALSAESCPMAMALADRKRAVVEWQAMAAVVDRLLFWIFLVATIVAYVVMLIVIPIMKPSRPWVLSNAQ